MADQNKDDNKPISSGMEPGPGERLLDASPQNGSTAAAGSAAGSGGGMGADTMSGSAMPGKAFTAEKVKETGARITAEAKQYAGDIANRVKESGRSMFEQQKETAVGQVESVAHAIRSTATQLQGEGQDQAGRYITLVADQLQSFSGRLREKDLDTIIDDAQNLVRRAPGTFFVGSVVAGFLLARFLKSSTGGRDSSMQMSNDNWQSPRPAADTSPMATRPAGTGSSVGADGTPDGGLGAPVAGTTTTSLNGSRTGGSSL
jgi:hypothetical protein